MRYKHDVQEIQTLLPRRSKWLCDLLDKAIGWSYGFTDEEVDFIINNDIKYRMGRDGGRKE